MKIPLPHLVIVIPAIKKALLLDAALI